MTSLEIRRHNSKVLTDLQEGDLVEFNRKYFRHWGVYVGNEEVVHLTGVGGISDLIGSKHVFTISGMTYNKAMVVKENFWKVAANSKAKRNNDKDRERKPLSPNEIVEKALSMLGEIGYNVLWNNCEHFAAFCRYNMKLSEQVENFFTIAGAVAVAGIGYGIYRHMKSKKEQEEKLKSICLFDQGESFVWF